MFTLPRGEFDLYLKPRKGADCRSEEGWKNIMMTDRLEAGEIAESVEEWSKNYEVLGARYNGKEVTIPKNYHWELRSGSEAFGSFKTRKDALEEMHHRKVLRRQDKTIKTGLPVFVEEMIS